VSKTETKQVLYLDHAATTPPHPQALELYAAVHREFFANPSSQHQLGQAAKHFYETTKESLCQQLHFDDGLLLQTASATESNNMVVHSFFKQHPDAICYLGVDAHSSLWYAKAAYREKVNVVPLLASGQYDLSTVAQHTDKPVLVLFNLVSQDLGTLHQSSQWHGFMQRPKHHLHLDATQALGKLPLDMSKLPFHSLSASAHKFGGTRGCGLLLLRNVKLTPLIQGGQQEEKLRAGTENIAACAAADLALQQSLKDYQNKASLLEQLDQALAAGLKTLPLTILQNSPSLKIAGLNHLCIPNLLGSELVSALSLKNIALSTGSACHENEFIAPRAVLAFGRKQNEALGSLRISFGPEHQRQDVDHFISTLGQVIAELSA